MVQNLVNTRTFKFEDEETGKQKVMKVMYNITLRKGKVDNVYNEYNQSVTKNSETFEYYSNKYNK